MKKSRIVVVGLIGLLLAGGLVLAGCDNGCPDDGDCEVYISNGIYHVDKTCSSSDCMARKVRADGSGIGKCDC